MVKLYFVLCFCIITIDQASSSLNLCFNQFKTYNEKFGFLYRIGNLEEMENGKLIKHCKDIYLIDRELNDIDKNELYHELQIFKYFVEEKIKILYFNSFPYKKKLLISNHNYCFTNNTNCTYCYQFLPKDHSQN